LKGTFGRVSHRVHSRYQRWSDDGKK
jgi:hypothetical protein